MQITNQDRDISILFNPQYDQLTAIPVGFKGKFMAYNIWCKKVMLGSFDSWNEATREITKILSFQYEIYMVSGYSSWNEWDSIKEVMRNEKID